MHPVRALYAREAWANRELLRRCTELDPDVLARETPGTLGTIPRTLAHVAGTGQFLLLLLTGRRPADAIAAGDQRGFAALARIEEENAARWQSLLDDAPDPDQAIWAQDPERSGGPGRWVLMAQYLHHGDTHRAQVGTVLGAAGLPPPRLDGWAFGSLDPAPEGPAGEWADRLLLRCFDHADWATHEVLEHCLALGEAALAASAPGTYGTVHETLTHLVDAHCGCLAWLMGEEDVVLEGAAPLDMLLAWQQRGRTGWRAYLESAPDHERSVRTAGGRDAPAWLVTLQAVHHVTDHLAHVGTILGASGLPVPDVDAWAYGMTLEPPPAAG